MVLLAILWGGAALASEKIPVTDSTGKITTYQPGPVWILLSGVDEHGLMGDEPLRLLDQPNPMLEDGVVIPTGMAAKVEEIRADGPRRFYKVTTVTDQTGWVSDFFVLRWGYLYEEFADTAPMYEKISGQIVAQIDNVSPVRLIDPRDPDWWQVESIVDQTTGWVPVRLVKESPAVGHLAGHQHVGHNNKHTHRP